MITYSHGGDIYSYLEQGRKVIDFSSNINPLGLPNCVKQAFVHAEEACIAYPDPFCRALCKKIAEYEKVPVETVVCGNGAADLIFRITAGLRPSSVLVTAPTFSEYEQAVKQIQGKVYSHFLKKENEFVLTRDFLDELSVIRPDMVFLCNPNNPTGKLIPEDLMLEIAEYCHSHGIILVIDECFLSFTDHGEALSMKKKMEEFPNMILLKAFTKFFAMPGLRLGYLICSGKQLRETVWNTGQPWSVSGIAQLCGIAALEDFSYREETQKIIPLLRNQLYQGLSALPLQVYSGSANYLLFYSQRANLDQETAKRGILIRNCSNYSGLGEGYYRVAVRTQEENQQLLSLLAELFGK